MELYGIAAILVRVCWARWMARDGTRPKSSSVASDDVIVALPPSLEGCDTSVCAYVRTAQHHSFLCVRKICLGSIVSLRDCTL